MKVELVPYDNGWPERFEELARRVRSALGRRALLVQHAGSTSVPGISAKPVIDIVLAVADSLDEAAYVADLEAQQFRLHIREPEWFEHRLFKSRDIECNLHVFSEGCPEISRMLAFRDRLRASEADRRLYESTKQTLAARDWPTVQNYADAKTDIVREILARQEAETR